MRFSAGEVNSRMVSACEAHSWKLVRAPRNPYLGLCLRLAELRKNPYLGLLLRLPELRKISTSAYLLESCNLLLFRLTVGSV